MNKVIDFEYKDGNCLAIIDPEKFRIEFISGARIKNGIALPALYFGLVDRRVLSMEGNHQNTMFNLQEKLTLLETQYNENCVEVARIRKNKNAAIEELQAENILLKNGLAEKQRTQESLRGKLAEAKEEIDSFIFNGGNNGKNKSS